MAQQKLARQFKTTVKASGSIQALDQLQTLLSMYHHNHLVHPRDYEMIRKTIFYKRDNLIRNANK